MNTHKVRYNECNCSPLVIGNKENNPKLDVVFSTNKLGPYLAGLIESDGHVYVPSSIRDNKGKKKAPSIEIAFDIKDQFLFEKIKDRLKGGYIVLGKNKKSGRLFVKKKDILLKLIHLINGYMRTPKIEALHRLIDWYNLENSDYNLEKLGLDTSSLDSNSWLSGFAEGDGNFYLSWKESSKSKIMQSKPINLIYYFRLSQRQMYTRRVKSSISESNYIIMNKIGKYFNTNVIFINRTRINYEEKAYLIKTDTIESKEKMFRYFSNYPLFGYKYFACLNLSNIHNLKKNSELTTEKGKLKLIEYSNHMKYDTNRDTWVHLDKFYTI